MTSRTFINALVFHHEAQSRSVFSAAVPFPPKWRRRRRTGTGLRFNLTVGAAVDRSGDDTPSRVNSEFTEHSERAERAVEEKSSSDQDSRQFALALARECWETKGEDLILLHVAPLVYWTQYMIIVTVFSKPQLGAMLAKVEKTAEEMFGRRPAQPAQGRSSWELLDFGDVVVNVLTADQREYYDLVRCVFW